jgi:hypothetical protein
MQGTKDMSRGRVRISGRWALIGASLTALALALPGAVLADTITLSIAPEPTEEVTSQVTYTASSAEKTFATVAVNNPGVPCAPDPEADNGHTVVEPTNYLNPSIGEFSGAGNYEFPSTGAYTVCGWLHSPGSLEDPGGGPVTAAASLPLNVRLPAISLSLRFPQPVHVNKPFVLELVATSQVKREVVVEGVPYTKSGCPVNYAAGNEPHVIDTEVIGGPTTTTVELKALRRGKYIFCAWADPYEDKGLDAQSTTSIILNLAGHHTHKHPKRKKKKKKRRHKTPARADREGRF